MTPEESTPGISPEDKVNEPEPETVDKAEYDKVVEQASEFKEYQKEAEALDFDTTRDYIEFLKQEAYDAQNKEVEKPEVKPVVKPPAKPAGVPTMDNDQLAKIQRGQLAVHLSTQQLAYKIDQKDLGEDDRDGFELKDLTKMINDPKYARAIFDMAGNDGNVYAAAAQLKFAREGKGAIRKQGADAKTVVDNAKTTADINTGEHIKTGKDDKEEDFNTQEAHKIAPPTPYEMPV